MPNSQMLQCDSLCVHQSLFQSLCPTLLCEGAFGQLDASSCGELRGHNQIPEEQQAKAPPAK